MRTSLLYGVIFLMLSCAKDNAPNCIQTAGDLTTIEQNIDPFDRILVNKNIELILLQGSEHKLKIESGEHLISDVNYTIDNTGL